MDLEKHKELGELAKISAHFQRSVAIAADKNTKLRKLNEKFGAAFSKLRSALDDELHGQCAEAECRNVYYGMPSELPDASGNRS